MSEKTENITTEQQNEDAVLGIKTKIVLSKNIDFFGPGLFHLLQYIDEEGTIHAASKKMGMSYSKCWKLLNRAEERRNRWNLLFLTAITADRTEEIQGSRKKAVSL